MQRAGRSRIASPLFVGVEAGAVHKLIQADDHIIDVKAGAGDKIESVAPVHRAVADAVAQACRAGVRPRVILGDCCQTIGVVSGLDRAGLAPSVIWIDSHGDFNTWETTPSGFLGGMPLAMLSGRGDQRMLDAVGLRPLSDDRIVLSDARDLDPGERDLLRASGVRHVSDVRVLVEALPQGPLYVHFDTDIIDARDAPAFMYPAIGGPDAATMRSVIESVEATGRVIAWSATVAWDPSKDLDDRTRGAVVHAMSPVFEP